MCTLPQLAGDNVSERLVVPTVASAIDLVVYLGLDQRGARRVREIVGMPGRVEHGVVEASDLLPRECGQLVRGDGFPRHGDRFARFGYHLADELAEDAVGAPAYYGGVDGEDDPRLARQRMLDAVDAHVAERGTDHLDGVRLVSVDAGEGHTATVTIEVTVYPLFGLETLMPFADGVTVSATGQ